MGCGCHKKPTSAVGNYLAVGDPAPDPLTNPPPGLPPGTVTAPSSTDYMTPLLIVGIGGLVWAMLSGGVSKRRR